MVLEEVEIERPAIVNGGVFPDCDIPQMKYFFVGDWAQFWEVAVEEEADQFVDRHCGHVAGDYAEEAFEHLA